LRGPFIVWLFVTLNFVALTLFRGSSDGSLPQHVTIPIIVGLLTGIAVGWGGILVFLIVFLAFWERRRSLKEILSSVGLKGKGLVKSVFWSSALFPVFIAIGSLMMIFSYFLGPTQYVPVQNTSIPAWYLWYMVFYSFFPVAVVEETVARGYILDRIMPQHPLSLVKALPAILLSSFLMTLWHIPSYVGVYSFSGPWVVARLAGNVFPLSVVLGVAYVRGGTRNILGPILIHFMLDALPIILMMT